MTKYRYVTLTAKLRNEICTRIEKSIRKEDELQKAIDDASDFYYKQCLQEAKLPMISYEDSRSCFGSTSVYITDDKDPDNRDFWLQLRSDRTYVVDTDTIDSDRLANLFLLNSYLESKKLSCALNDTFKHAMDLNKQAFTKLEAYKTINSTFIWTTCDSRRVKTVADMRRVFPDYVDIINQTVYDMYPEICPAKLVTKQAQQNCAAIVECQDGLTRYLSMDTLKQTTLPKRQQLYKDTCDFIANVLTSTALASRDVLQALPRYTMLITLRNTQVYTRDVMVPIGFAQLPLLDVSRLRDWLQADSISFKDVQYNGKPTKMCLVTGHVTEFFPAIFSVVTDALRFEKDLSEYMEKLSALQQQQVFQDNLKMLLLMNTCKTICKELAPVN